MSAIRRFVRLAVVSVVQSGAEARKLAVGVREVRQTVASHLYVGGARSTVQFHAVLRRRSPGAQNQGPGGAHVDGQPRQ